MATSSRRVTAIKFTFYSVVVFIREEYNNCDYQRASVLPENEIPRLLFYVDNILNDFSYISKVDAIFVIAGLVHIETSMLRDAFSRTHHVLTDSGRLFITIREGHGKVMVRSLKTLDGETYDRNFIAHTKEEIIQAAEGLFSYVDEVGWDGTIWHNYILQKQWRRITAFPRSDVFMKRRLDVFFSCSRQAFHAGRKPNIVFFHAFHASNIIRTPLPPIPGGCPG